MKLLDSGRKNRIIMERSQEKGGKTTRGEEKKPAEEEDFNRQKFS